MRTRAMAALAAGLLGVAGCGEDDGGGGGGKPVLGFINGSQVEFNQCVAKGLRAGVGDAAEIVELNSRDDVAAEVANGEDLLSRRPKALVLQTVNFKSGTRIVAKANDQDVPVLLTSVDFVRDPSKVSGAVVFNLVDTGAKIGAFLKRQVATADGEQRIGIIAGAPGAASDLLVKGVKKGLGGARNARIVFEQPGMWNRNKAAGVAENMLQAQPDLDYVFVASEEMAFGVLESIRSAGRQDQVRIVTNNGTDAGLEAVRRGDLLSTTDASAFQIGLKAGRAAGRVLSGGAPDPRVQTQLARVITKANADRAAPYCEAPA